jgi:hypothetical protein
LWIGRAKLGAFRACAPERHEHVVFALAEKKGHIEPHVIIERLLRIDSLHTTPMEALRLLAELKKLAEIGGK